MRVLPRSVRARLTLWHAAVLAVVICSFSAGVFLFVRAQLSRALDRQVADDLATIEKVYQDEKGDLGELAHRMGLTLFEVAEGETVVYRTRGWPPPATAPVRIGRRADPSHRITVARDETPLRQTLATLAAILMIGLPSATALAVVGGYVLAGRVLAPVGAMADTARKITAESLAARLPVENPDDEFGRLARVFNDTLSRLHQAFEQLRRFTADASHELRTPLTALRSVGEVALQRRLSDEGYREVVASMLEEVDRLTRLVENLLTLTRAEGGRIPLTPSVVNLGELAVGVSESLRVLSEEREQVLKVEICADVGARCDPDILRQGLINLLHNAIKYTPRAGTVLIAVNVTAAGDAVIEVKDTGPGIAPRYHERIFERFARVDAARSTEQGGIGLGLAIARWAVEANGGRIEVESAEGAGSVFRIVLPHASPR